MNKEADNNGFDPNLGKQATIQTIENGFLIFRGEKVYTEKKLKQALERAEKLINS